MAERDTIWSRDGRNVEDLPDPFAVPAPDPGGPLDPASAPPRRRRWRYVFYGIFALLLVTLMLGSVRHWARARPLRLRHAVRREGTNAVAARSGQAGELPNSTVDARASSRSRPPFSPPFGIDPRLCPAMIPMLGGRGQSVRKHSDPTIAKTSFRPRPLYRASAEVSSPSALGLVTKDEILSRKSSSISRWGYGLRAASRITSIATGNCACPVRDARRVVQAPSRLAPQESCRSRSAAVVLQEMADTR